mgnify:CR=1 FL=1
MPRKKDSDKDAGNVADTQNVGYEDAVTELEEILSELSDDDIDVDHLAGRHAHPRVEEVGPPTAPDEADVHALGLGRRAQPETRGVRADSRPIRADQAPREPVRALVHQRPHALVFLHVDVVCMAVPHRGPTHGNITARAQPAPP